MKRLFCRDCFCVEVLGVDLERLVVTMVIGWAAGLSVQLWVVGGLNMQGLTAGDPQNQREVYE